jgi:hypothetical protein
VKDDEGLTLEDIERMLTARAVGPARRKAYEHEREFKRIVEAAKNGTLSEDLAREAVALDKRSKKFNVVDKSGRVLRVTTPAEYFVDVDRAMEVRFGVVDGAAQQTVCAGWPKTCPKQAKPSKTAFTPQRVRKREGGPWLCASCSRRKTEARKPPELRSEIARKANGAMSSTVRKAAARKRFEAKTPEQRMEMSKRGADAIKAIAVLAPDVLREALKKNWATRRARAKREGAA